jgi:23S rRNA pseudouridine2457 synthase
MARLILFNNRYGVITQFSPSGEKATLKNFIPLPGVYPAGRLDTDSDGLLFLTDDGVLQARVSDPKNKLPKVYRIQVEGTPADAQLEPLRHGVGLGNFFTLPAQARRIDEPPGLWARNPPIRLRTAIPTRWLEITLYEVKNRQVRRMAARKGFPTLRG